MDMTDREDLVARVEGALGRIDPAWYTHQMAVDDAAVLAGYVADHRDADWIGRKMAEEWEDRLAEQVAQVLGDIAEEWADVMRGRS